MLKSKILVGVLPLVVALGACKRTPDPKTMPPAGNAAPIMRDVLCMEHPEGCVYCSGRQGSSPAFLESGESRPSICDPKDENNCVEFCTALTPECALPWSPKPHCLFDSDVAFQRAVYNRDTADRPEITVTGKLVDENGRRVEGAFIDVWVARGAQQTALGQEVSAKDGTFRIRLRGGPWTYSLRFSKPGFASEFVEGLPAEKLAPLVGNQPRVYRLEPESMIKGRIVDSSPAALAVAGAEVTALRTSEDSIESSRTHTAEDGSFVLGGLTARRYSIRTTKFGWRPLVMKAVQAGGGTRVAIKLTRATVIRGVVRDKDGNPEANATIAAVLSEMPGVPNTPIFWTSNNTGAFAQDRFVPGTYYLWARKGEMLAYPPEKIELGEGGEAEVELTLHHKGSRVTGQVLLESGARFSPKTRAMLISRSSPLAFPRPAVADLNDQDGTFTFVGILPGRYEISVHDETRPLTIIRGPRDVEVPIEADATVPLLEAVVVRPRVPE